MRDAFVEHRVDGVVERKRDLLGLPNGGGSGTPENVHHASES